MNGAARFTYQANPSRVLFGRGRLSALADEVAALGCRRALLLCTPEQTALADAARTVLGASAVEVFAGATMHTPAEVTEAALRHLRARDADVLVAVGGGSTTGLGKALALRTELPLVAVPTTYAGSEMTRILGETKDGRKTTVTSERVLPRVVIYDTDLTLSLPPGLSVVSGFNAMAHAVEALYARDANPIVSLMAEEGLAALARALPGILAAPRDPEARALAQYGAWLCGTCLGSVGMALHHKVCHVLGGSFGLPHAETHTVMLAHVTAYNAPAAPEAIARVARALACEDAAGGLHALAGRLRAPAALRDLGMPEAGIARAAELVLTNAYWNPRAPERAAIEAMLRRAWGGAAPQRD